MSIFGHENGHQSPRYEWKSRQQRTINRARKYGASGREKAAGRVAAWALAQARGERVAL